MSVCRRLRDDDDDDDICVALYVSVSQSVSRLASCFVRGVNIFQEDLFVVIEIHTRKAHKLWV